MEANGATCASNTKRKSGGGEMMQVSRNDKHTLASTRSRHTRALSFWVSDVCTLYPAQTRVTVKHRRVFPSLKPEIGFPSCCWLSFTLSETGAATPRQNLSTSVRARVHVPSHIPLCYNARSIWKEIWYLLARLDWCTEAVSCSTGRDVFPAG